jgi:hypothetical protein
VTGISPLDPFVTGASTGLSKLDGLLSFIRELGGLYILRITLSEIGALKLGWLLARGRDFLSVTPAMSQAIATELITSFRGRDAFDADVARQAKAVAAEAARSFIVKRFETGGFDQQLAALSPLYSAYKRSHRLDPRIGIAKADLLNEIKGPAQFAFVRQN